jgi:hypothetical protein
VVVQQPAPEPPPAPPSDATLNKAITDFAAGRITSGDLASVLAGEPIAPAAGNGQQQPGAPPDTPPVVPEVTRLTIEAANAALAQIPGGPKTAPYQGTLRYVGTDWNALFQRAASNDMMSRMLAEIVDIAGRADFNDPINFRHCSSLDDLPLSKRDIRAAVLPQDRKALFALATSDCTQTSWLMSNGAMAAIAAKRSGDAARIQSCVRMLEELNKFHPLQRSGFTAWDVNVAIPPDGDGVWLATSWGLTAITEMCTILGDSVPPDLRSRLEAQTREEIKRICVDWRDRRPWFVKSNYVVSNQWIEPNLGLIRACLFLGDPALLPAYNLGVENLLASINAQGAKGEFLEGVSYAAQSLKCLHEVLELVNLTGDPRASSSGFYANNWSWFSHMHLPGNLLVNCCDSMMSVLPEYCLNVPFSSFSAGALARGNDTASSMRFLYPAPTPIGDLSSLKYADFLAASSQPARMDLPPFAHFPGQEMVVWRTRFEPIAAQQTAYALWLKGGSLRENHIHREQGHVTIVVGSRIVISNCGTTEYNASDYESGYAGPGGSSMMQVAGLKPCHQPVSAPIFVNSLGTAGGNVDMNTSAAHPGTTCTRNVSWDSAGNVRIIDNVSLPSAAASGTEIYRFHTGSAAPLNISGRDKEWDVTWTGTTLHLSADSPIVVDQVTSPNKIKAPFQHQTIRIKTKDGTARLQLVSDFVIDLSVTR